MASTVTAAVVVLALISCAGCGDQNGAVLAKRACVFIDRSLTLYARAQQTADATARQQLQRKAAQQLNLAEPLAAAANSDDGNWGALMTTLSERNEIDEAHLAPDLRAQCQTASQGTNGQGPGAPPTTFPPGVHVTPTTTVTSSTK